MYDCLAARKEGYGNKKRKWKENLKAQLKSTHRIQSSVLFSFNFLGIQIFVRVCFPLFMFFSLNFLGIQPTTQDNFWEF